MSIRLKDTIYDLVEISNESRALETNPNGYIRLYAHYNNEINFGGSDETSVIYFGYRKVDAKPIPTSFIFGESTGTATITASGFKKKDSSDSYVLLGGGGSKLISDFSLAHSHPYLPTAGGTMTGSFSIKEATNILLRPNNSGYTSGIGYDTSGNECISIWAKNTVTRFRWHAGIDMSSLVAGTMMGITPDFEISKADGSAKGYIAGKQILTSSNYSTWAATSDHNHNSSYVTSLSTSGDNVTWTKNGSSNSITVPFSTETKKFKRVSNGANPTDLNTCLSGGGIAYNYGSSAYWSNGPSGMSYGQVLQYCSGTNNSLSGQLAWDVIHNSTTDTTGKLWWRASDDGTWTEAKWHQIAYTDSDISGKAATAGTADVATIARSLGTNNTIKLYAQNNDEINFGGTPTNGSTTIYFGYKSVDSRTVPTSYIFGGSDGTATVTANGFKKKGSSESYVLLGNGGHKAISDFATSGHTHTKSQITDFPTSMPASDVYSWAKAATKPSYNFGEIGAGVATIGDGTNRIMWRTNASYASGVYYSTPANESVVFANKLNVTSWMFVTGDPTAQASWQTFTPSLQIKNQRVTINKAIATGTDAEYNLDVNGSFNATSGYINKNAIIHAGNIGSQSVNYATSAGSAGNADTLDGTHLSGIIQYYSPSSTNIVNLNDLKATTGFQVTGWAYAAAPYVNSQPAGDGASSAATVIKFPGNYPFQIYRFYNTNDVKVRGYYSSSGWTSWATLLMSDNYTSYTVKKDGTGASGTWGISISGNAATATNATNAGYATSAGSASSATTAGSADVATIARSLGTNNTIKLYAQNNDEINFGGTNNSSTIYFGYRAVDSKPIPTAFVFGSSTGTATLTAGGYKKKDSSDSYVLLGGGGHKAVSDFATSGHTHSQYLTSIPSHTHDYLPTAQVSQEQNTDAYTWIRGYALTDGKLRSHVYNTSGKEWSYWIGISTSKSYGSILRTSYNDGTPTIQVMGLTNGTWSSWRTCSFEGHTHNYAAASHTHDYAASSHTHDYAASSHTHSYLPLSGGNMNSGVRIAANGGNLYIGNSNNAGWVMVQDICSQDSAGDTYWSLRTNGAAHFKTLYLGGEQITFTT